MSIPTFGHKEATADYHNRYGVYAIIPDSTYQNIILVQAPNGAWFLPGGEIEENENQIQALERELIEELGFKVSLGDYLGQADEYFYSSHRDTYFYNPAYIYEVLNFKKIGAPLEDFNCISWFPVEEAKQKLKRGSHKWGVDMWQKKRL